jgi:pimeloyl-ACP methyl ester carboxylesterase
LPIDPPTPFFRLKPSGESHGKVLVVHGLNANKNFMQLFSAALADAGFEVYAIDLPGHGDSRVGFSTSLARDAVLRTIDYVGGFTAAVGHSLGGGLLLDVAHDRPLARMVLISPGPTPIDHLDLSHTLVVTGTYDIPAINAFVPQLEGAEWWSVPRAFHSSAVFDPNWTRDIVAWLGGNAASVRATARLRWNLMLLISAVALGVCLLSRGASSISPSHVRVADLAARFVLTGTAGAIIMKFVPLMGWLHLFAADYLVGLFFAVGLLLCTTVQSPGADSVAPPGLTPRKPYPGLTAGATLFRRSAASWILSIVAASYAIGIIGFLAADQFTHFALADGRWWRFPFIALASFPLFYFDEIAVRPGGMWKALLTGSLTRVLLAIAILMGVLTLNREAGFLVLVIHVITFFWIALWVLAGIVRRNTEGPFAAAIFASLVQGWMFAAWFITR